MRVKDNTSLLKEDFESIVSVVNRVADKTLEQLEKEGIFVFPELVRDSEDITKNQMVLRSVNDQYAVNNVMGFLGYGHERLIIESRFSSDQNDYFLQYMLEKVMDFPNILELNTNANQDNRLLNLLLFLFPYYLKTAIRKGVFKTYVHNEYNNSSIKGAIDIPRHVKVNTPFIGNVAYNQREFSFDNYLTELIRHTIEFIKRKSFGDTLLRKVKDEVNSIVSATEKYASQDKGKIVQINKKKPMRAVHLGISQHSL